MKQTIFDILRFIAALVVFGLLLSLFLMMTVSAGAMDICEDNLPYIDPGAVYYDSRGHRVREYCKTI